MLLPSAVACCWLLTAAAAIPSTLGPSSRLGADVEQSQRASLLSNPQLEGAEASRETAPPWNLEEPAEEALIPSIGASFEAAAEQIQSLARKPVEAAELGGWVLATKARIMAHALLQAAGGSLQELEEGSLQRAWQKAQEAVVEAQEASSLVETTAGAGAALGVLMVFVLIACCWALELFLTKRADERGEFEDDSTKERKFFHAFSFARYLMVWYVVMDNYYKPEEKTKGSSWVTFARWGELGVPWFFLVSGFCHSYQQICRGKSENLEDFFYSMIKRVSSWYPLYAACLTWCALRSWSIAAEDWSHYLADVLLINGIIWDKTTFPFMMGDWWLCFLMVYLLAWNPMHQALYYSTKSVIWTVFTIAYVLAIPSSVLEWYWFGQMAPWVLIQYWPAFVFGQALAAWLVNTCMQQKSTTFPPMYVLRPVHELPLPARFGTTLSLMLLGIIAFSFSPNDKLPLLRKPVAPLLLKGGLLPFLGMMVAGLACEVDPIAKLFARFPFRWTEKLFFTTFILQVPIHNTVSDLTGWQGLTWTFSASLLVASILGYFLFERPWRQVLGLREK